MWVAPSSTGAAGMFCTSPPYKRPNRRPAPDVAVGCADSVDTPHRKALLENRLEDRAVAILACVSGATGGRDRRDGQCNYDGDKCASDRAALEVHDFDSPLESGPHRSDLLNLTLR